MARKKTWGTPGGRLRHYVFPRPWFPRLVPGLVLAVAVAGLLAALHAGGRWLSPLREPLMPGALAGTHSTITNCGACHDTGRGVPDFRCQRCHDESGPGRMTQAAHAGRHVTPPGTSPAAAGEGKGGVACVTCHVEHRGRTAPLAVVSDSDCASCHGAQRATAEGPRPRIADFGGHPEFAVVLADREARSGAGRIQQVTGIFFSHAVHLKAVGKKLGPTGSASRPCQECHKLEGSAGSGHRELAPVSFDADCVSCHRDQLVVEAAPAAELVQRDGASVTAFTCDPRAFTCGASVVKNAVAHRDPWIVLNLRKLRRELYPAEHAREYGELLARAGRLRRRLFLAQPLAVLSANDLASRRDAFTADLGKLDARSAARAGDAPDKSGGRARVEEVEAAAAGADAVAAEALRAQIRALAPDAATPVGGAPFEERRDEILRLLDAVAAAPDTPAPRRAEAAYLRLRVLSLAPGEAALDATRRARQQRDEDLLRVEDEIGLRREGIAALGNPGKGLREVEATLADIQGRLQELKALEAFPEAAPGDRPRKEAALRALAGEDDVSGCAKCHEIRKGTIAPVTASRRVLTLADFRHEPHLNATPPDPTLWERATGRGAMPAAAVASCASCHPGIEKSAVSTDLHLQPIASCRECHRPGAQRQECQLCHRYHPPSRL